ncbi:unnamed protein product [Trifolium pratense]|uniref:Uncharacterized protein n=1 Tax=Trifolium pratense TaxID=57577 RepID=A0ACB0ISK1_TRIPR|nr:unnamed protein product [Trifolium pratense]
MSTYDIGACHLSLDLDKGWHVYYVAVDIYIIGMQSSRILPFQASCEPRISVLWKDACSETCGYHGVTFYVILYFLCSFIVDACLTINVLLLK